MRMSNEEYAAFVDSLSPRSPIWGDLLRAGLVGGAICVVGQALVNLYEHWGASAATAATWCSITLVFLGALLTGLGVYDDLARFAGAGSLVPITGFANSVVSPALEFKTEGFDTGTAAGASPRLCRPGTISARRCATTASRTATGKTTPSRRARRTRRTASPATGDKRTHLEWDRLLLSMLRKPESRWQSAAASNGIVCFFLRTAQSGSPSAIGGNFQ